MYEEFYNSELSKNSELSSSKLCHITTISFKKHFHKKKKNRGQQEQLRDSGVLRQQHVQRHQRVLRVLLQRRHNQIKVFKKTLKMRHL